MDEIFIPAMGMAPDDVTVIAWLREPGDEVAQGDVVALIETSKAELEVEAPSAGVLGRQQVAVEDRVAPGSTIAVVLLPGETEAAGGAGAPEVEKAGAAGAGGVAEAQPVPPAAPPEAMAAGGTADPVAEAPIQVLDGAPVGDAPSRPDGRPRDASVPEAHPAAVRPRHTDSPRQRRMQAEAMAARKQPAEATPVPAGRSDAGSGRAADASSDAGTSRPEEVAAPAGAPPERDRFRSAISDSVSRSWQEIPHFAVTRETRAEVLLDTVRQWRAVVPDLTVTDLLVRAVALSLVARSERGPIDVGLAIATERGVVIPVLQDVLALDVSQLARARRAAAERARAGRMLVDDTRVPATTLSNLGSVGVDQFTGVVPYGQTSLFTVGRAAPRPVVEDGRLAVATTMSVTLNVDHRSWDGMDAGQALDRLARILVSPAVLAVSSTTGERHD